MMDGLALLLAFILAMIALVHIAWAFGMAWPGYDEESLARTVVGTPGMTKMPPSALTFVIAILLMLAAFWPLWWRGLITYPHYVPQILVWLGMWVLTIVFLGRGLATYLRLMPEVVEPFRRLNRLYFSPLCILLGLGFLTLVLAPAV